QMKYANYRNRKMTESGYMSADEKTRYLAEIREKALKNERSILAAERRAGFKEGFEKGIIKEYRQNIARRLLKMGVLSPEQIAQATAIAGIGK
ncbi:MAG: hypothetical protein BWK80_15930, partial [Desulfobacteraceae bacterium IS3]